MRFPQSRNPFLQGVQIIADYARVAHLTRAPFFGHHRGHTLFVDIQSKIEFFFHWCGCLFELLNCNAPGPLGAPAVGAALLYLKKASSPRKYERQTHSLFQPCACAFTIRAQP